MITPATEEKIKRDAGAGSKEWREQYTRPVFVNGYEAAYEYGYIAGAKPWAEMCEELERALETIKSASFAPLGKRMALGFIEAAAEESLSKLREFRGEK